MRMRRLAIVVAVLASVAIGTSACGAGSSAEAEATDIPATGLEVRDPWVKATEGGMTGAFATLVNPGDSDVTVVSAESDAAGFMELHEVVDQAGAPVMQLKDGGFAVTAGGERVLEPGADHLMLMDLVDPVEPGEEVSVTLTLDDGSTVEFTAQGRDFAGANEDYVPGHGGMDDGSSEDMPSDG